MQIINQGERLLQLLAEKEIFFHVPEGSAKGVGHYHLYFGVPVHCLMAEKKKSGSAGEDAQKSIDILICRGSQAVLAIVLDAEYRQMEQVFSDSLKNLPHYFLISDELTEEKLHALADSVAAVLSRDCQNPQHTGCCLYAASAKRVLGTLQDKDIEEDIRQEGVSALLHRKHLLGADGAVTHYGRYCGLFQFCVPKQSRRVLMCKLGGEDRLRKALRWEDREEPASGLSHRLARMRRGLPSEYRHSVRTAESLQALLDTPLETLYYDFPQEKCKLYVLLQRAQLLSRASAVTAFGSKEELLTYGDVIYAVWNLREYTGADAASHAEVMGLCEDILWNLSAALLEPAYKTPLPACKDKRQSLLSRLQQVQDGKEKYPVLSEPMPNYVCAGAILSGSEYPVYLYDMGLCQYLAFYGYIDCSFRQALQYIHALRTSDDENEVADYSMLIFDLLVDTVSSALV